MKTTEVFVEQVLIGLLVILNFALLASPALVSQLKFDFQTGAAVVGAAYLIGIVFDRFADTLLEDIERHNRLKFALNEENRWLKSLAGDKPNDAENASISKDFFPEDEYRMKLFDNGEAVSYANYLRTRIRLSRAMAVLIPGLTVAFLLRVTRERISRTEWISSVMMLGLLYGGALMAQLIRGMKRKGKTVWYKPPRTDRYADEVTCYKESLLNKSHRVFLALIEPSFWALTLMTCLGARLSVQTGRRIFLLVPVAGIALTLLTGWTWLRIHHTFMAFLRDFCGTIKKPQAPDIEFTNEL